MSDQDTEVPNATPALTETSPATPAPSPDTSASGEGPSARPRRLSRDSASLDVFGHAIGQELVRGLRKHADKLKGKDLELILSISRRAAKVYVDGGTERQRKQVDAQLAALKGTLARLAEGKFWEVVDKVAERLTAMVLK